MDEGPRVRRDRTGDAGFVNLPRAGEPSAFGILVDAWADTVYDRLSHRGFTTADALDLSVATFAEVYRQLVEGASNDPFGVQVLRIARRQALTADRLRVDLFLAVGPFAGDQLIRGTQAAVLASEEPVATFLLETAALLGDSASEVLDLQERHDFDATAIAALLDIPVEAVTELATSTPDAFRELVGVQLVWRQGTPACGQLAAALARHTKLEAGTRRAITQHLRGCSKCRAAATPALDPVLVLGAIPMSVTPAGFKPPSSRPCPRPGCRCRARWPTACLRPAGGSPPCRPRPRAWGPTDPGARPPVRTRSGPTSGWWGTRPRWMREPCSPRHPRPTCRPPSSPPSNRLPSVRWPAPGPTSAPGASAGSASPTPERRADHRDSALGPPAPSAAASS